MLADPTEPGSAEPAATAAVTSAVARLEASVGYHPAPPLVSAYEQGSARLPDDATARRPLVGARLVLVGLPALPRDAALPLELLTRRRVGHTGGPLALPELLVAAGARGKWTARPAAVLARAIELADGPALPLADLRGVLLPDVTARFELTRAARPGARARERLELLIALHGPEPLLEVALDLRRVAPSGARPHHELLLLEPLRLDRAAPRARAGLVAFVPCPLAPGVEAVALLLELEREPRASRRHQRALAAAQAASVEDPAERAVSAGATPPAPAGGPFAPPGPYELRRAPRQALVRLGLAARSEAFADLALLAREAIVRELRDAALPLLGNHPVEALGWPLTSLALQVLAALADERPPPPWVEPVLAEHVGGLALAPGLLERRLAAARDLAEWERLRVATNRLLLADNRPQVRVLAHEWLCARGAALPGYAPLAPAQERRAALTRLARDEELAR